MMDANGTRGSVDGTDLPAGSPVLALRGYAAERLRVSAGRERVTSLKALGCVLASLRGERIERPVAAEASFDYFRSLHRALDADPARCAERSLA